LPSYILPIFPALAVLVAALFEEALDMETTPGWIEGAIMGLVFLFIAALFVVKKPELIRDLTVPPASLALTEAGGIALLLGVGVFILVGAWGMRHSAACFGGILLVHVLLWTSLASLAAVMDPYYSAERIGHWLRLNAGPGQFVVGYGVSWEDHLQTLVFYARRRVAVYGSPGELSLGVLHDPEASKWFVAESEADAALERLAPSDWVVTEEGHWSHMQDIPLGTYFRPIMHVGRLWLLQRV
jgi:hypothetical protein